MGEHRIVTFAFQLARTAKESMRELEHVKGIAGVEIFFIAVWILSGVLWLIAMKLGAVQGMWSGIVGFAGILSIGWVVYRALRARSQQELEEYYGQNQNRFL